MKLKIVLFLPFLLLTASYLKSQICSENDIITRLSDKWAKFGLLERGSPDEPGALTKIKRIGAGKKQVIIYGTWHSLFDDGHQMYMIFESNFNTFKPTVVLTENYEPLYNTASEAIRNGGDVGYTRYLAQKSNLPNKSWDAMAYAYNKIVREFGADASLLMALNVLDSWNRSIQFTADNYGGAINLFMYEGVSITPQQTSYEYYKKIFKKFFKEPLLIENDTDFREQRLRIIKNKKLREIQARFMALRDYNMLNIIKDELKIHDRVFIQAGAAHVLSTEDALSCVFSPQLTNKTHPVKYKVVSNTANDIIKLVDNINNQQIHIYPVTNTTDSLNTQKEIMTRYIRKLRPDLILTEEYAPLFSTKNETITKSGLIGYARYIAAEDNISFQKWSPSWNSVYYNFVGNSSPNELFATIIGNDIKRHLAPDLSNPFLDAFVKSTQTKFRDDYPFQSYQLDFSYFINKTVSSAERKDAYSLSEMKALIKNQINYSLLDSINKWRVYNFLDGLYEGRQNQKKRIVAFIDKTYMPYVKEYITSKTKL